MSLLRRINATRINRGWLYLNDKTEKSWYFSGDGAYTQTIQTREIAHSRDVPLLKVQIHLNLPTQLPAIYQGYSFTPGRDGVFEIVVPYLHEPPPMFQRGGRLRQHSG